MSEAEDDLTTMFGEPAGEEEAGPEDELVERLEALEPLARAAVVGNGLASLPRVEGLLVVTQYARVIDGVALADLARALVEIVAEKLAIIDSELEVATGQAARLRQLVDAKSAERAAAQALLDRVMAGPREVLGLAAGHAE